MTNLRVNTEQLKKAEIELIRQTSSLNRILDEAASIRKQIMQFISMNEISYSLKKWDQSLKEKKRDLLKLALALDSTARMYETYENKIIEHAEFSNLEWTILPLPPVWNIVEGPGIKFVQEFGGEK